MRAIQSIYRYIAFCMHRNSQRVKTCLFSTGAKKSNFDAMPPSEIGKVFAKLRQNPKQTFLLDGGTGEELFRRKVPDDREIWSATALVHPQFHGILEDVHTSFLQSGSNAITTNSYGVVPGVGFEEDEISLYMEQSGKIARSAITKHTNESPSFVFGSLGPLIESYRPDMILAHDEGVKGYKVAYKSLAPYVDAFLAETMSCVDESIQVLDALASSSDVEPGERPSLLISYSVDSEGNFRDGEKLIDGIRRIIEETNEKKEKIQLLAILFNCAEPEAISRALERIHGDSNLVLELESSEILLGAYAHTLTPVDPNWTLADSEVPQPLRKDVNEETYWKEFVQVWINKFGVRVVGGCCGITPEHISYIRTKIEGI